MKNFKKGFSMAEVLTTLILIGVVAAISIPSLGYNYHKKVTKTKIKSAMVTFDSFIRQIALDVGTRNVTNQTIYDRMTSNNCANITSYAKTIYTNGCIIKTSDGVWWDLRPQNNANNGIFVKVAVSENNLNNITSKTVDYPNGAWFYATQTGSVRNNNNEIILPAGLYINNQNAVTASGNNADVTRIVNRLDYFTD